MAALMADRSKSGFTLLEITISVAIMVLIVTVVFPQIGDIAKVQLHTSARRLAGTIRHSCFTAAMTKKRYWLSYNLDKQEYWLSEAVPDPEHPGYDKPVELKRGPGRRRKLAEGIKFSAVELADGSERTTGEASTEFYLGRSGRTIIELHDQKNRVWCVEVLPYGCRLPKMGPC